MFDQAPTPPAKQPATFSLTVSALDPQWAKPVFRAPDLPSRFDISAEIPFTPLRVTEIQRGK